MSWTTEELAGKTADVFTPNGPEKPSGVVLFLHGYDGVTLRDNTAFSGGFARHRLACVCPIGPQCWWSDRTYPRFDKLMTPIDFLKRHIPDFAMTRWGIGTPHIAVSGFEMGGQGALQLAYRDARRFPVVAAVSPKVDFDTWHGFGTSLDDIFESREAARQATAILHIHPLDWPKHQLLMCDPEDIYCFDGVRTLMSKLNSSGIPFESDIQSTCGGFGWDYVNSMANRTIDFIAQHITG